MSPSVVLNWGHVDPHSQHYRNPFAYTSTPPSLISRHDTEGIVAYLMQTDKQRTNPSIEMFIYTEMVAN